eukprot:480672-Amphidinium_carterae.1
MTKSQTVHCTEGADSDRVDYKGDDTESQCAKPYGSQTRELQLSYKDECAINEYINNYWHNDPTDCPQLSESTMRSTTY